MICGTLSMLALLACFAAGAPTFRQVPYAEKLTDRDLSLCVTFDKHHVNADVAGGNPTPITLPNLELGLRGMIGFDGAPGFKPEGEEALTFDVRDNVDLREGTVVLWLSGSNFAPGEPTTDGEKRGNVAYLQMHFQNSNAWVDFKLYEHGGTVYFDWRNSVPPHGWGSVGRVQTALTGIDKSDWFQLAITWTRTHQRLYLNGELQASGRLPLKTAETLDLVPDPKTSYLGLKNRFHADRNLWEMVLDDVYVYSRALTSLEIKNRYLRLLADTDGVVLQPFHMQLHGVDDGSARADRLEVELDFHTLADVQRKELTAGRVKARYRISGPGDLVRQGEWELTDIEATRIVDGIASSGTYDVTVTLEFPDGSRESAAAQVERPDLSFFGNRVGSEDTVPAPWTPLTVAEDRSVSVWNRVYRFGAGPFPVQILVAGKELLTIPPRLQIATAAGETTLDYRFTDMRRGESWVEFNGVGEADSFALTYTTRIEFDGMLKTDFVINGAPEIHSMALAWAVRREYSAHLMTPTLQQDASGEFAFRYPRRSWNTVKQLWLVSEKGGFCWAMVNDANWVYDPDQEIFAVNRNTGECRVTMIAEPVALPEATPYQALFIATPTRPLPERNRAIRFHDSSRWDAPKLLCSAGEGLVGHGTFKPHETGFAKFMERKAPNSVAVYGMADALTTTTHAAQYLRKYWNVPGAYVYNCNYKKPTPDGGTEDVKCFTVSACSGTRFPDYILGNIQEMFRHPYGDRVWMIYYDLCGNRLCSNPLHGCELTDKLGRRINTFALLNKRELIKRTVRLCHRNGRTVMLHAQRSFFPMMSGLGDYWFPGEQHGGMLRRNPYGYTDEIPEVLYRTEYNRNVLGTGVMFLPALGRADMEYFKVPEYTEAMLCMLLPHDIETSKAWAAGRVLYKVWDIFEKYRLNAPSVRVHRFFEQDWVTCSNPDVRVSWYECPDKRTLLVLANKTPEPVAGTVDLSELKAGVFPVRAEYSEQDLVAKDGRVEVTCPARGFDILAFPPKTFYPHEDDMSKLWGTWKSEAAAGQFSLDRETGCTDKGSLMVRAATDTPEGSSFCFVKQYPAVPGRTYVAEVSAKTEGRKPEARISLTFQAQDEKKHFLMLPPQSVALPGTGTMEWERLMLSFTVPTTGKWADTRHLLVTLGSKNNPGGSVWFDDFRIAETQVDPKCGGERVPR